MTGISMYLCIEEIEDVKIGLEFMCLRMEIPRCNSERAYQDMKSKPPLSTPPIAAPPKSIFMIRNLVA